MQNQPETTVKTYHSAKEFEQDQRKMAAQGWQVTTTTSNQPRAGIGRTLALGVVGAAIFRQKPEIIVTYQRDQANIPPPPSQMPEGLSFSEQVKWKQDRQAAKRGMPPGLSFKEQVEWHKQQRKKP